MNDGRTYRVDTKPQPLAARRDEYGNLKSEHYSMGELGILEIQAQQVGRDAAADKLKLVAEEGEELGSKPWNITYWMGSKVESAVRAVLQLRKDLAGIRGYTKDLEECIDKNHAINGALNQEVKGLKRMVEQLTTAGTQLKKERDEAQAAAVTALTGKHPGDMLRESEGETRPYIPAIWEEVRDIEKAYAREHKWLNEAAEAADCDLDQVANVIRNLRGISEDFDWAAYNELMKHTTEH